MVGESESENDIDLLITGRNGNVKNDALYNDLHESVLKINAVINYKHLCGEYPTSSSFALWLAANIIKRKKLPKTFDDQNINVNKFHRILIHNTYLEKYHSLMLLSSCDT